MSKQGDAENGWVSSVSLEAKAPWADEGVVTTHMSHESEKQTSRDTAEAGIRAVVQSVERSQPHHVSALASTPLIKPGARLAVRSQFSSRILLE